MTTTTVIKSRTKTVHLHEDVAYSPSPLRVDREKSVIHGVKVLGLESRNRRRYTLEAMQRAAQLYEGVNVNADHPKNPVDERSIRDRIGWLSNVHVTESGLYADLHLLSSDPASAKIFEAAERRPELFGLSHNADGKGKTGPDGVFVVTEITEVRHVDIVSDPATTHSLRESRTTVMTTVKAVFEAVLPKLHAKKQPWLKSFMEQDEYKDMMPAEMPEPEEKRTPEEEMAAGFEAMVMAVFRDASLDLAAKKAKINELLKAQEKLMAEPDEITAPDRSAGGGSPASPAGGGGGGAGGGANNIGVESRRQQASTDRAVCQLQEQVAKLTADKEAAELREWVRAECDRRAIPCDQPLMEGLVAMKDRPAIGKHLDYLKPIIAKKPATGPRSSAPGRHITESKAPATREEFVKAAFN